MTRRSPLFVAAALAVLGLVNAGAQGEAHGEVAASDKLWGAVKTVIVADLVMSVDNVIAIAGAAGRLFRTPSAITRQVQRLEAALGAELLDRSVKPPRLKS